MISQKLQQKMLQKLSPQQIQLMKLLQVPTVAIEQRIKEELENNPALEEGKDFDESNQEQEYEDERNEDNSRDDFDLSQYISDDETPSYKTYTSNYSADDDDKAVPLAMGDSFQETLMQQLGLQKISEDKKFIGEYLIGNLDESGYLRRDLEAIVDDLTFYQNVTTSIEELEELLKIIQRFDPAGVGARNLQECLLLQIRRKNREHEDVKLAQLILEKCFNEFTKKHYKKIIDKLEITEDQLKLGIEEILKLNPKPGNSASSSSRTAQAVVPDFIVNSQDGELVVTLNGRNAPELKVSKDYSEMLKGYAQSKKKSESDKKAVMFVKQKLDSAKWFIDAIKQRQHTLMSTMQAIVEYQRAYFEEGDETKLRPMILKDIAEKVKLDISTISRVANSKYVQTPFGTFLLKSFFSESMQNEDGEEVSTREIKKILQDTVEAEDKKKPFTDEKLAAILKEKGYPIARRTVAKYREQLHIPVGRMRKEL